MFLALCPAKINLFLKLSGKLPSGYHELESLFAFLDLSDELIVTKSDVFKLAIGGEFGDEIDVENNLFTTILNYFVAEFGVTKNLKIKVTKNIPVSAGLGGGSSNAAYFLHALNQIFSLNLSITQLQRISLNFGSDIAFLLQNKAAIIRGRGDQITDFPQFPPIPALLINPKIALSTKEIFAKFDGDFSVKSTTENLLQKDVFELMKDLPNDLQKPAISTIPLIATILHELKNCGAQIAKMSGSGASCFGIFGDEESLDQAEQFFNKNFPHFFVKKVKILSTITDLIALP